MKKIVLLFPIVISLWSFGQLPPNDPHWELDWEDNFNTFNSAIWAKADHYDHNSANNGYKEKQVFLPNNVYVQNGSLVCELKNETYSCPSWALNQWNCAKQYVQGVPYSYTAGWVDSKQTYDAHFGYIEARIKFEYGNALWPSFWTFVGSSVSNPTNAAEIDIAEMLGELGNGVLTTNIHKEYCPTEAPCSIPDYKIEMTPGGGYQWNAWHTYGIEWSPQKIIWYLDGNPIRTFPNHGIVDPVKLILSIGLRPDENLATMTSFPYKMYTDYVKVYKLKKDCNTVINACNFFDWGLIFYDYKVKKEIFLGDGTCSNTVYSNQNFVLRASQGITINGDFTIQQGGQVYFDASLCE